MQIGQMRILFLVFADADVENDVDTANAEIQSTSTRGGQDADFLISADEDIDADIYL